MSFIGSMFSNSQGAGFQSQGTSIINQPNLVQQANTANQQLQMTQAQQQQLAQLLQSQANGAGPNPALAQLQQTTQANQQAAAGMIGSQKGINPALAARLASQTAAGANQQASGQAATMRANQQLAAQGQLGSTLGQMGNEQLQQQSVAQNAIAAINNANVGMQSNVNDANAGIAKINTQGQQQMFSGVTQGAQMALGLAEGGEINDNNTATSPQAYSLGISTQLPDYNSQNAQMLNNDRISYLSTQSNGPQSSFGKALANNKSSSDEPMTDAGAAVGKGLGKGIKGLGSLLGAFAKGGKVKSPIIGEILAAKGEKVPGQAKVSGNSYSNDNVPALLSPGEIVLPRSVTQAKDPVNAAARFVAAIQAKKGRK